jgi:CBS domain-containing protein
MLQPRSLALKGAKMLVKECMTKNVELASPEMTIREAARKMRDGDFGSLPVGANDRLIGVITDRDIVTRTVAEGKHPDTTRVREAMSEGVLYCYEDQAIEEVARNMGDNQVRRLPVLSREKRLVGILSLGDMAVAGEPGGAHGERVEEALCQISRHEHNEPGASSRVQ